MEAIDGDNQRAGQLTKSGTAFVWWDDNVPERDQGWVLRTFDGDGDWDDDPLDADDRDDPGEAADEAARLLPQPGNHPDDLRVSLADAGQRRSGAERARADAKNLTGLSRRAIYDILEAGK